MSPGVDVAISPPVDPKRFALLTSVPHDLYHSELFADYTPRLGIKVSAISRGGAVR